LDNEHTSQKWKPINFHKKSFLFCRIVSLLYQWTIGFHESDSHPFSFWAFSGLLVIFPYFVLFELKLLFVVLAFDSVETGRKQIFSLMRFGSAHFFLLAAGSLFVFLDVVQIDEIGPAGTLLFQMFLKVLFLIEAAFQFAQIFILVDVQLLYFGDVSALTVPD